MQRNNDVEIFRVRHRDNLVWLLIGDGANRLRLEESVAARQLESTVRFLPYQAREQLALTLSAANLHVVSMHPRISGLLVPSKIYGIMASGTPMLAIVPRSSDVHTLVTREQLGFSVRPGDLNAIEQSITECLDGHHDLEGMGLRSRRLAEDRYDFLESKRLFERVLYPMCRDVPGTDHAIPIELAAGTATKEETSVSSVPLW
jgi:colanic acid biosynthesis glycosyl transferase WcaI